MPYPTLGGPDDPRELPPPDRTPPPTGNEGELLPPPRRPGGVPGWVRAAAILAAVAAAGAAALGYRAYHRQRVLREGIARARAILRADTFAGYRDAAQLLEPLSRLDPIEAGALRAFALAMLFADYREARAAEDSEALLVEPGRAARVPDEAQLAYASLALGRQEAGTAAAFAVRARVPMGLALQARTSLLAGNLGAAAEPLARAAEADPTLPAVLALRGDVQRRSGMAPDARRSYQDALASSPLHPRAAYGLGKLALAGRADAAEARGALSRLLDDRQGTPPNERARAGLLLAALKARAGDRAGATAALDAAGVDRASRAWMEKAVTDLELARGGYLVVGGAPAALLSASDDDPYVAPPPAPPKTEPVKPQPRKAVAVAPKKQAKKAKVAKASKPVKKKGARARAAPRKKKPADPARKAPG